jgi:O-methyltransferase involved in polyketide biosynthesis
VYSDLNNANYVAGDAFNDDLWNDIATKLTIAPVAIFAEGFMQYTSKAERDRLFKNVREILTKCGGCFFFEDSLTFHPEIYDHDSGSSTQAISKKMQSISKNSNLTKYISQESLTAELESYGFDIERASPVKDLESESFDNAGSEILNIFKHWKLTIRK